MTIDNLRDWCISNLENIRDRGDSFIARCPFCGVDEGQFKINVESGAYNCFRASCANFGCDPSWMIKEYENSDLNTVRQKYYFLLAYGSANYKINNIVSKYNKVEHEASYEKLPSYYIPCYDDKIRDSGNEWSIPRYLANRIKSKRVIAEYEVGYVSNKTSKFYNYCVLPCYYDLDNVRHGGYVMRSMSDTKKDYYSKGVENVMFGTKQYLKKKPELLIINEGSFDVMRMALYNFTTLGALGVKANGGKLDFLKKVASKISKDCIVMFDDGADSHAKKLAAELFLYFNSVKIAKLEDDPGDSSYEQILHSILNAQNA